MFVKPWDESSKRILDQLVKDNGRAFTKDISLPRAFGRRYPELIENDFLTIARADRKKESVFVTKPNVMVIPIGIPSSQHTRWKKYKFHKIF
jgi:hypothetical protein